MITERRAQRDENQDKAQTTGDGNDAQSCYINTSGVKMIVIKKETHTFFFFRSFFLNLSSWLCDPFLIVLLFLICQICSPGFCYMDVRH